ncbi:hypothetical protein [Thalassotalea sp. PP2-459]|uniref:hypothetical protein n=1 Tax=Thalassotalea sp. PP2-459 TaxID=1742724 RepID=UPI0009438ABF|nr:hypothetical protein [Thalassotalea sp. PP2-459]OKY26305.1 hypothetical protein BI291_12015 [Thalassotalea sp. PP2-459]
MTINDEILTAANTLANQGIKPTVARIKTKLAQPVPLPTIISVLKSWQHDPNFIKPHSTINQGSTPKQTDDLTNTISLAITKALTPLQEEISALKKEIQELKNQLNK